MKINFNVFSKLVVLGLLLLTSTGLYAQDDPTITVDLSTYVVNFTVFITSTVLATDLLKNLLKSTGLFTQILSWVTGVVIAILASVFDLGLFTEFSLVEALGIGVAGSLAANGVADIGILKGILALFKVNVN